MENDNGRKQGGWLLVVAAAIILGSASRADVVELINGDRYSGTVISVTMTNVALRSSVQGLITLPREKLATITFGEPAGKDAAASLGTSSGSKVPPEGGLTALAQRLLGGSGDTNRTDRIAEQLLEDAGPEATQTYKQMVKDLLSGSLTVAELRKQARQAITDAEQAKEELGPEAGELLESYLSILRQFIQEPAPKEKPQ